MNKLLSITFTAAACVVLAACGSSDSTGSNGDESKAGAGASAGADLDKFCSAQAAAQAANPSSTDPSNAAQAMADAQKTLRENGPKIKAGFVAALAAAPTEIKADMQIVADASIPYFEELEKANYDMSKMNFSSPAFAGLSSQKVQDAAARVGAYYQAKCGTP